MNANNKEKSKNGDFKPIGNKSLRKPQSVCLGLDIGTANIVVAQKGVDTDLIQTQLNVFYSLPYTKMTEIALLNDGGMYVKTNENLHILGDQAENFAHILGGVVKRPVAEGIINPKEEHSTFIVKALISKLINQAPTKNIPVCFSVPGEPADSTASVFYHTAVIQKHLESLGYIAEPINEGLAIILSELAGNNFTGIGISIGGGMCNVCVSYLAVPVITYSLRKGGDYIDQMAAHAIGVSPIKVKRYKERELDLTRAPVGRISTSLHIYYEQLCSLLAESLQQMPGASERMPSLRQALPIVLSGGSVLPPGTDLKFKEALAKKRLPFKIADVLIAPEPLLTTARGSLQMALTHNFEK